MSASRARSVTTEEYFRICGILLTYLLSLPFLASLLYGAIIYHQERYARASNGPDLVEGLFLATERLEPASPG